MEDAMVVEVMKAENNNYLMNYKCGERMEEKEKKRANKQKIYRSYRESWKR